jgi:hypothetical protein
MARKTKKSEEVSVFDLFDDIATEPLQGNDAGGPLVAQTFQDTKDSDSSTVSFEGAIFSESTATVSG